MSDWIDNLQDASFRGVPFQVEKESQKGGRRLANHQYPLRNIPNPEDLGSKQRQYGVTGFIVGTEGVLEARDALIAALDADGAGQLIHPTYGQLQVMVPDWSMNTDLIGEQNIVRFQISFVQAGSNVATTPKSDTAQASQTAATNATDANALAFSDSVSETWA